MLTEQRKAPRPRRLHVNVADALQRRSWCSKLNCTEQQLGEAAQAVGSKVEDVRRYLKRFLCVDTIEQRHCWCQALECSETQLFDAVTAVGLLVEDVRRYLAHRESATLRRANWAGRALVSASPAA